MIGDLVHTPQFVTQLIVAVVSAVFGCYIIQKNGRDRVSLLIGITILTVSWNMLCGSIGYAAITPQLYSFIFRIIWIPSLFGELCAYLASIYFREQFSMQLEGQKRFFWFLLVPCYTVLLFIMLFSDIFFDDNPIGHKQGPVTVYAPNIFPQIGFVNFSQTGLMVLVAYNSYMIYRNSEGYDKRKLGVILLTSVFAAISVGLATFVGYFVDIEILAPQPLFAYATSISFLVSEFALAYSIVAYNAFIEEGRKVFKDFAAFLLTNLIWVVLYLAFAFILLLILGEQNLSPTMLAVLAVLPVLTHNAHHKTYQLMQGLLERKRLLPKITFDEVSAAVRRGGRPKNLSGSPLLSLQCVNLRQQKLGGSKEEALRKTLIEVVEQMQPRNTHGRRTRNMIKCEILRMSLEDQAVESQILWDLGFESESNVAGDHKPRFPVQNSSEYKATSIMSYRRLKKEALEDMRWRLLNLEKKALRIGG